MLNLNRPKGFARGLTAEKIIGATNDPGELYFLIKVDTSNMSIFTMCFLKVNTIVMQHMSWRYPILRPLISPFCLTISLSSGRVPMRPTWFPLRRPT